MSSVVQVAARICHGSARLPPHRRIFHLLKQRLDALTVLFRHASSSGSTSQASPRISCQHFVQLCPLTSVQAMARRRHPATPTIRSSRVCDMRRTRLERHERSHLRLTPLTAHLAYTWGIVNCSEIRRLHRIDNRHGPRQTFPSTLCSAKGPILVAVLHPYKMLGSPSGCDGS